MRRLAGDLTRAVWRDPLGRMGGVALVALAMTALAAPLIAPLSPGEIHRRVEGVILQRDAAGWGHAEELTELSLHAVAFTGDGLAAVGADGVTVMWDRGSPPRPERPVEADLEAVAAQGDELVAVGAQGTIATQRGGVWSISHVDQDLFDVALDPDGSGLIVGTGGTVLRREKNGDWDPLASGVDEDLFAVDLAPDGTGLVVGADGTVLAWDGSSLSPLPRLGSRDLFDVDVSDGTALVVGERGTILRGADAAWTPMIAPDTLDLHGVRWLGDGTAIAVGDGGTAALLTATGWAPENPDYSRNLLGVDATPEGEVAAVGTDPIVDSLSPPSAAHYFGTNELGQDLFSQAVWGSRTALLVGSIAALLVVVIGTNVGLIAGYFRGGVDSALMRIVDVMYGIPFEPFALILVAVFRPGVWIVIGAIALLVWRTNARVVRSQVLSLGTRPFVKAARVAGASNWRIIYVHIAPNILPLIFLQLAIAMAFAISAEATLSFLGLGPAEAFSWGTILFDARLSGAWRTAWWWTIPPGILILVTVLSVFFVARALETFSNPRLRGATGA